MEGNSSAAIVERKDACSIDSGNLDSGERDAGRLRYNDLCAPVAQLDRANASEALGREFESRRAHHNFLSSYQVAETLSCSSSLHFFCRAQFLHSLLDSSLAAPGFL